MVDSSPSLCLSGNAIIFQCQSWASVRLKNIHFLSCALKIGDVEDHENTFEIVERWMKVFQLCDFNDTTIHDAKWNTNLIYLSVQIYPGSSWWHSTTTILPLFQLPMAFSLIGHMTWKTTSGIIILISSMFTMQAVTLELLLIYV